MDDGHNLFVWEKLLASAYDLYDDNMDVFSAEQLTVAAWKNFPETFGLRGFYSPEGSYLYPDSTKINEGLRQSNPLRREKYVFKEEMNLYLLTLKGKEEGHKLLEVSQSNIYESALDQSINFYLKRILNSQAFKKYSHHQRDTISFYDACIFWGISYKGNVETVEYSFTILHSTVAEVNRVTHGKKIRIFRGGPTYSMTKINRILDVHKFLIKKYRHALDRKLKKRNEE